MEHGDGGRFIISMVTLSSLEDLARYVEAVSIIVLSVVGLARMIDDQRVSQCLLSMLTKFNGSDFKIYDR